MLKVTLLEIQLKKIKHKNHKILFEILRIEQVTAAEKT